MVQINYDVIPDEFFINYLKFLTDKFFKILPIYEKEPETLQPHLESLLIELIGSETLFEKIRYDARFLSLLTTLQYFIGNECDHRTIKRETFRCIRIIDDLKKKYIKEE